MSQEALVLLTIAFLALLLGKGVYNYLQTGKVFPGSVLKTLFNPKPTMKDFHYDARLFARYLHIQRCMSKPGLYTPWDKLTPEKQEFLTISAAIIGK